MKILLVTEDDDLYIPTLPVLLTFIDSLNDMENYSMGDPTYNDDDDMMMCGKVLIIPYQLR